MNADMKEAFARIKPVCDVVMVCPSPASIKVFTARVADMKKPVVQELQQYILFPFITHIKSKEMEEKHELQWRMVDAVRIVLEKVTVNSYEMCMKIETALLSLVFDNSKTGMIADVPEELKLSVMRCLTVLMLNLDKPSRQKLLKTQVPLLAQAVFVAVHLAKLERLRALRLAAINCLTAHTVTHAQLTDDDCHILDPGLEASVVDMLSNILPGVLAALQDVATCTDNPGHAVVVAAIRATHRILCITMHDKHLAKPQAITAEDFAKVVKEKAAGTDKEVSYKDKNPKDLKKRSPEWYEMAGERLEVVTESLVQLRTHEHWKVRKELAVFCCRLLLECNRSMQPSIPIALDVLISLSRDEYPEVAQYCSKAISQYFSSATDEKKYKTMDSLCENFYATLNSLPRILNNIDSSRKLSALNLLHGYIQIMCDGCRPQMLTTTLSVHSNMQCCCNALLQAAAVSGLTSMSQYAARDVMSPPPTTSPWVKLRHLDTIECERQLQAICRLMGAAECAELVLDRLLDLFHQKRDAEIVYIMNWMGSAPTSLHSLVKRILNTYIEEDVWYLPLEVSSGEAPVTNDETYDPTVYNPRAWVKESVPDLYEGATETRYTDISYQTPRMPHRRDPHTCATLAEAHSNMVLSCMLTEGIGFMARRLMDGFQPYLLKTLCLILERVGSKYEMLHLAGLKAINDIAFACGNNSVGELIRCNADYFTSQVTLRLKKAWNSQSALEILSVVMEYSDSSILDCLYGIVEDVLVQSCDKYHEKNLQSYLQVFLTFLECIRKWFPVNKPEKSKECVENTEIDVLKEVIDYVNNVEESERLLNTEEFEKEAGKSAEEMYQEDLKENEDNLLDYDDRVTQETPSLPQHVKVTITILKRCVNFISSKNREETLLALRVMTVGLPILRLYEDELLPLVHQTWAPFVTTLDGDVVEVLRSLELMVVLADLSKDFVRSRAMKEVLPQVFKYLYKSAGNSYLKDTGSAYRTTAEYNVQVACLSALPTLVTDLRLDGRWTRDAMACVDEYLSNKQPKPLQILTVKFYKTMLSYDYGATWHHLRKFCNNEQVLEPPPTKFLKLEPVVGTPYEPRNKDYEQNIKLIFYHILKTF